jgi:hypothetical protein
MVITWYRLGGIALGRAELRKLIDEPAHFPELGSVELKPIWQSLKESCLLTFDYFRRIPGVPDIEIDTTTSGWEAFDAAIHIRNNFVHPKTEKSFIVTPEAMLRVMEAWTWFTATSAMYHQFGQADD